MRLLVDSHVLIWALDEPNQLSGTARAALQDSRESNLCQRGDRLGNCDQSRDREVVTLIALQAMDRAIGHLSLSLLPITVDYADRQAGLPNHHRDPFDRLLVAQSLAESMPVVSSDAQLDAYGIVRIW